GTASGGAFLAIEQCPEFALQRVPRVVIPSGDRADPNGAVKIDPVLTERGLRQDGPEERQRFGETLAERRHRDGGRSVPDAGLNGRPVRFQFQVEAVRGTGPDAARTKQGSSERGKSGAVRRIEYRSGEDERRHAHRRRLMVLEKQHPHPVRQLKARRLRRLVRAKRREFEVLIRCRGGSGPRGGRTRASRRGDRLRESRRRQQGGGKKSNDQLPAPLAASWRTGVGWVMRTVVCRVGAKYRAAAICACFAVTLRYASAD